jgi:membrane glycosyltransferase
MQSENELKVWEEIQRKLDEEFELNYRQKWEQTRYNQEITRRNGLSLVPEEFREPRVITDQDYQQVRENARKQVDLDKANYLNAERDKFLKEQGKVAEQSQQIHQPLEKPAIENQISEREAAEQRIRELEEQWAKHEQEVCKDRGGREL